MSKLVIYRQEVQRTPPQPKGMLARLADFFRSSTQAPLTLKDPELARRLGLTGGDTGAGVVVNETTALNYSAVWAAVSLISSQIASLPLILYKREANGGKERYTDHKTYRILHDEFNPEMTSMVARETMQAHCLTWGNAYAEIERDVMGRPIALWPLLPYQVTPFRDELKRLMYRVSAPGVRDGFIPAADMLHIPGLGFDGLVGYSPIHMAKESLALGMAAQKFGATFFGNGATFGGALEHPGELGEAAEQLRKSIEALHQGPSRAHRFLILEEGMKYTKFGVDPNAAQFLETRQFEVTEVARWFNIPPHKLRDLMRATFSNIEQQSIEFVTDTLRPWMVRWEQECNRKLVSRPERNIQYVEHLVEGLLRGDIQSRYSAYAVGRQWGWLCADDIRGLENMNPLPNGQGQIYLVPQNMMPAARVDDVIDAQIAKTQTPPEPPNKDDTTPSADRAIAVLQEEIREARERETAALERAAKADEQALTWKGQATEHRAEADRFRSDAEEARREIATKEALLVVAQEQAVREQHAREVAEGQRAEAAEAKGKSEAEAVAAKATADAAKEARTEAERVATDARAQAAASEAQRQAAVEAMARAEQGLANAEEAVRAAEALVVERTTVLKAETAEAEQARSAAESALAELRADVERKESELADQHAEVEQLSARAIVAEQAHVAAQEQLRKAEADAVAAEAVHAQALADAAVQSQRQLTELESSLRAAHAVELQTKVDELASVAAAAQASVERSDAERAEMAAAHERALAEAQARAAQQLADVEAAIKQAHDAALREQAEGIRKEATQAHEALVADHDANVAAITQAAEAEREALRTQHAEAIAAESARVAELRETLAAAQAALEQAQATVTAHAALVERADRERVAAVEAQQAAEARAVAEAEARTQVEARAAVREDYTAVLSAHRSLVADTMRRMIEREADRVRRSQATPQKLRAWVDTFYTGHEDLCRNALLPVVRVHLAWVRSEQDPAAFAGDLARQHVEESLRDLRVVLDEPVEEFHQALSAMLHRWEHERATVIADRLMQKELDYVRRTR